MLEVFKIDETSDFPYYQQLYQFLKEQKVQESLPSEKLPVTFGIFVILAMIRIPLQ